MTSLNGLVVVGVGGDVHVGADCGELVFTSMYAPGRGPSQLVIIPSPGDKSVGRSDNLVLHVCDWALA